MIQRILSRIFSHKLGVSKFLISGVGLIIGLTIVLSAIQFYVRFQDYLNPEKNFPEFIILHKEVSLLGNTLTKHQAGFDENELEDIRTQPFVIKAAPFKNSTFRVILDMDLIPRTDVFLESIDKDMLDVQPYDFHWKPGDKTVPIILSENFVRLYNFSFAIGADAPQFSKSTLKMAPLRFVIKSKRHNLRTNIDGKIVGFTERINSVIVPKSFIEWANEQYGSGEPAKYSKVMIKVTNPNDPNLKAWLNEKHYDINQEQLRNSTVVSVMQKVMVGVTIIGVAFILLSLVIISTNFALIISQAKTEIKLLFQLGYTRANIVRFLFTYFGKFLIGVLLITGTLFYLIKYFVSGQLKENGIPINTDISSIVLIVGLLFLLILVVVNLINISRTLTKQR